MRAVSLIFALTTAASVGGCARHADVAAEARTIRELERRWVQAVAAKDTTAIGNVYAEDGEFLPPGAQHVFVQWNTRPRAAIVSVPSKEAPMRQTAFVAHEEGDLDDRQATARLPPGVV
jgi:ketosteroid isomerase-like protein